MLSAMEKFRGFQLKIPSRVKGFTQVVTLTSIVDLYFLEELTKTAGVEVFISNPSHVFHNGYGCCDLSL